MSGGSVPNPTSALSSVLKGGGAPKLPSAPKAPSSLSDVTDTAANAFGKYSWAGIYKTMSDEPAPESQQASPQPQMGDTTQAALHAQLQQEINYRKMSTLVGGTAGGQTASQMLLGAG